MVTLDFCQSGCQCPQKTEIPPAVFTRFITYRVNAEWLPVLRKLVPLISLVRAHSFTDRIMAYNHYATLWSIVLLQMFAYLNVELHCFCQMSSYRTSSISSRIILRLMIIIWPEGWELSYYVNKNNSTYYSIFSYK